MLARRLIAVLLLATAGGAARAQALELSNPRHVRALYLDLLGRTPDEDELSLAQASTPPVLVSHLVATQEFWEHWYEDELYYFC